MKKACSIIIALIVTLMFVGCATNTETNTLLSVVGTTRPEYMATFTTMEAVPSTEPEYTPGDFVWCVWHANDLEMAQAVRYKIVSIDGDKVTVTNKFYEDEKGYKNYIVPIEDCYINEYEAEAVAYEENVRWCYEQ